MTKKKGGGSYNDSYDMKPNDMKLNSSGDNLIEMKNELAKIQAQQKVYGTQKKTYGLFDIFTDNKNNVPAKAIQLHNPTVFAVITSVIYILIHIIIYKQTNFEAWKIFGIIFAWPILIEFLSRTMNKLMYIPWLLSIVPLIVFISYTVYKFRDAVDNTKSINSNKKNKNDKKNRDTDEDNYYDDYDDYDDDYY